MPRKRKAPPTARAGDRLRVITNGLKWGGVEVPRGTLGTVYLADRAGGRKWRAIHFDGLNHLQPNGYPFGIGGDETKDFMPNWAERA
jgi:hypothetical protein